MALQKTHTNAQGVQGNHWQMVNCNINFDNNEALVVVCCYIDSAAKAGGALHIDHRQYIWEGADFPFTDVALDASSPKTIAYTKMVADDGAFWSGAVVVAEA